MEARVHGGFVGKPTVEDGRRLKAAYRRRGIAVGGSLSSPLASRR